MTNTLGSAFLRYVGNGFVTWLVILAGFTRVFAQVAEKADAAQAYEHLWNEATASVLVLAAIPDVVKHPPDDLKKAQARLERAVVRLIGSQPPIDRLADHHLLLPVLKVIRRCYERKGF